MKMWDFELIRDINREEKIDLYKFKRILELVDFKESEEDIWYCEKVCQMIIVQKKHTLFDC